jgi:signal transduction histidine kinase
MGSVQEAPGRRTTGSAILGVLLRLVMPLTDLVIGTVLFSIVFTGVVTSIALLPAFLLGVPVFRVVGAISRGLARLERRRMHFFLGLEIPEPAHRARGWRQDLKDAPTWRAIAYHLVQFFLSILTFSLSYACFGLSLSLLSMPWWLHRVPVRHAGLWVLTITDERTAWLAAAVGLLIGLFGVAMTLGLTALDGALARGLLGVTARDLERRVDELEESRARVVDSVDAERRRIERDLHDGAQQRLVALAMNLGRARARYDDDPEAAKRLLDEAHLDAKQALVELRDLARGIHPAVLTDRGLDAALSGLAGRSPVPVTLDVAVDQRCSPTIEAIAYFVVSEALANVAKHAAATSVSVSVRRVSDRLILAIRDNGVGGADETGGSGLRGLADRVGGVDGSLRIDSPAGGPTLLIVELPCES